VPSERERRKQEVVDRSGEHEPRGERVAQSDATFEMEASDRERQRTEPARQAREQPGDERFHGERVLDERWRQGEVHAARF
jgi:hypothetical protein